MTNRWLIIAGLLAIVVVQSCARYNHIRERGENRIHYVTDFGFLSGGEIDIKIEPNDDVDEYELTMIICNEDDYWDAFDAYTNSEGEKLCDKIVAYNNGEEDSDFCSVVYTFQTYAQIKAKVESGDWYYFDLVNCNDPTPDIDVDIEYTFFNPGKEHLPYDVIPLPGIYSVLILLYGMLLFGWMLNWATHIGGSNKLHKLLFLPLIIKMFICTYAALFWAGFSSGGNATAGLVFGFFYMLFIMLYELLWNACLFLVSLGWGVVPIQKDEKWCICIKPLSRLVLPVTIVDMCIIPIVLFALFLSLAAPFPLYNAYYLLLANLVYVVCIVYTFINGIRAERKIRALHPSLKRPFGLHLFGKSYSLNSLVSMNKPDRGARTDGEVGEDEAEDVANFKRKIRLVSNYKYLFILYYVAMIIVIFFTVIFWIYFFWIFVAFYEAIQYVFFLALLVQFRVRTGKGKQSPYFSNSAYDRFYDEFSSDEAPPPGDVAGAARGTFYDDAGSDIDSTEDDHYKKYYDEEDDLEMEMTESEVEKTV